VKFYGIGSTYEGLLSGGTIEGVSRKISSNPFSVSYGNGFLSIKGYEGVKSIDVISLDGRKVASFAPAARVSMNLARGTYFLSAKRNGVALVQSFAVLGR